jgi:hypothetical protein
LHWAANSESSPSSISLSAAHLHPCADRRGPLPRTLWSRASTDSWGPLIRPSSSLRTQSKSMGSGRKSRWWLSTSRRHELNPRPYKMRSGIPSFHRACTNFGSSIPDRRGNSSSEGKSAVAVLCLLHRSMSRK